MIIYNSTQGVLISDDPDYYLVKNNDWSNFINDDHLFEKCVSIIKEYDPIENGSHILENKLLKPITNQEIWAAGVTYFNSKMARQEESSDSGGSDFYAKVYTAERPELFFKSSGTRAVGHLEKVAIREDSSWNVPEPELTLLISSSAKIIGYTIGNDMSSRSIEGENPLYLPQAKSYDRSASIGPGIYVTKKELSMDTKIKMSILRNKKMVFNGETKLRNMVRKLEELVGYLFRELSFPDGCFLMTGTGIIPPSSFTLHQDDLIHIEIEGLGILTNQVG